MWRPARFRTSSQCIDSPSVYGDWAHHLGTWINSETCRRSLKCTSMSTARKRSTFLRVNTKPYNSAHTVSCGDRSACCAAVFVGCCVCVCVCAALEHAATTIGARVYIVATIWNAVTRLYTVQYSTENWIRPQNTHTFYFKCAFPSWIAMCTMFVVDNSVVLNWRWKRQSPQDPRFSDVWLRSMDFDISWCT